MPVRYQFLALCFLATDFVAASPPTSGPSREIYNGVTQQYEKFEQRCDEAYYRARALSEKIARETGRSEISAESLHQAQAKLDDEVFQLELGLAGISARRDAILSQLKNVEAEIGRAVDQDAIVSELGKIVGLKQRSFDALARKPRDEKIDAAGSIAKGDTLQIRFADLNGPGTETIKVCSVDDAGNIRLPYVGELDAAGKSPSELEVAMRDLFRQKGAATNLESSIAIISRSVDVLNAAATELAEARARLAVQKEHVASAAGGDMVATLRKELVDQEIAAADCNARLKVAQTLRDKIAKSMTDVENLRNKQADLQQMKKQLDRLNELRGALEQLP